MDNIYVSIASYRDLELTDTVYSLLKQSKDPNKIFLYIFCQDEHHPKLEHIFNFFNFKNFIYHKVHFSEAKGVGYARHITQSKLTTDFKYYLQIDSHTRFIKNWDEVLINDYENSCKFWNSDIIFSSYPLPYVYDENGNEKFTDGNNANIAKLIKVENKHTYKIDYQARKIERHGEWHKQFCAGFAFGLSKYFIDIPYDKLLYFEGEEHLMSIRFFCNNIKIIAPYRSYCYHHYYGINTRIKHWETDENWGKYNDVSLERIKMFFEFKILDKYGITNIDKYREWETFLLKSGLVE